MKNENRKTKMPKKKKKMKQNKQKRETKNKDNEQNEQNKKEKEKSGKMERRGLQLSAWVRVTTKRMLGMFAQFAKVLGLSI